MKKIIIVTTAGVFAAIMAFVIIFAVNGRQKAASANALETVRNGEESETAPRIVFSVVNNTDEETEAETEPEPELETQPEVVEETKPETIEITYEEIIQIAEENQPIEVIDVEELVITEDTSTDEHVVEEVVDIAQEETVSSKNFEVSQLVHGIDVSKWQGNIDWSRVANSGITFAIIKCGGRDTGDGTLYEDSKFEQNIQGALANGIQVGIYFFSQATSIQEAYEEASYCIHLIEKYQITYPVAYDWESANGYRVNRLGVSNELLTQCADTFCSIISSHGYQPMVYFCRNDWYNRVDGGYLCGKYKTWLAVYFSEHYYTGSRWIYGEDLPDFKYSYQMWQYGVTNSVDGIDGYVDMDIAFFTYSNYSVDGLQEPEITVSKEEITTYCCPGTYRLQYDNLLEGVKGTNSIGYETSVKYAILDKDGKAYKDNEEALETPGTYTLRYSMRDPKKGLITKDVKLTVVPVKVEFNLPEKVYIKDNGLPTDFTFVGDKLPVDEFGNVAELKDVFVKELFIVDDIIVDAEDYDKDTALTMKYHISKDKKYRIDYVFTLPKLGDVKKIVQMENSTDVNLEDETEQSETESGTDESRTDESRTDETGTAGSDAVKSDGV